MSAGSELVEGQQCKNLPEPETSMGHFAFDFTTTIINFFFQCQCSKDPIKAGLHFDLGTEYKLKSDCTPESKLRSKLVHNTSSFLR